MPHLRRTAPIRPALIALGMALALALGGCASVIRLDNDVRSYPQWQEGQSPAPGDGFRFDRLPSQQAHDEAQRQLESLVAERLIEKGLVHQPEPAETAKWSVEVSARSQRFLYGPGGSPYSPWPGPGLAGRDYVVTGSGQVVWMPWGWWTPPPHYQRELSVIVRDRRTGRAVYESRAAHDGPWADHPRLWEALAQAALDGFPTPPPGPRRVVIEVPR